MLAFVIVLIIVSTVRYASAQPIPLLPPPAPESTPEPPKISQNDKVPPRVEILTDELHEGKNVFKVRITDNSSLTTREVKYVHDGQLRVDGLFRDQNNVYRALIDIHPPSRIVTVTVVDANGNVASSYKEYEITKPQDIFTQIIDKLSHTISYIQNLLGW
jgi:hypothetical protein